jgi:DnaJ-class molecular chaperone
MLKIKYDEFEKAVETFGLIGLEHKDDVRKRYLRLSKKFLPDMPNGNTEKFQEINKAYKILIAYVDNFKFRFTKEEFQDQYPFSKTENGQWSLW